jgi:hypothetical protein
MYEGKYRRTAEMSFNHDTNPVKINFISPGGECNTRDGQAWPKHVVIAEPRQLCFDGPTHPHLHKTERG